MTRPVSDIGVGAPFVVSFRSVPGQFPPNQAVVTARTSGGAAVVWWSNFTVHTGAERSMQVPAPSLGNHSTTESELGPLQP